MKPYHAMFFCRGIFVGLMVWAAMRGAWNTFAFSGVLFLGSLFLVWLSTRNPEYAVLDSLVSLTFSSTIVVSLLFGWGASLFGFDKLYHILGGMCLAWFASILFRGRRNAVIGILLVTFVLGVMWELLELAFVYLPAPFSVPFSPHGWADSALDVVADMLGGIVIVLVRRRKKLFKARRSA